MSTTRAAEAPHFELPGLVFTGLASPSRGSADLCTWRLEVAPGFVSDEGHTLDRDEIFMVLGGTVRLSSDGVSIGPGDVAVVPACTPIQVSNVGDGTAELIVAIGAGFSATAEDGTTIGTPPWAL